MPILTAKVCKSNAEQFPDILKLYVPPPAKVLDMTYGSGVFWQHVRGEYEVWKNDIDEGCGDYHYDFAMLPEEWTGTFDAAVFDPPYKLTGTQLHVDTQYGNKSGGYREPDRPYWTGMSNGSRILRDGGTLIVKCMDQVVSGKQVWMSKKVYGIGVNHLGLEAIDRFVMIRPNATKQPHAKQVHAHKNHSFWWVFRKR